MYIVTIDQGTSSTKTALWDAGGDLVAEATASYELHRPKPLWAEIDAEQWWNALCTTVSTVLARGRVNAREVGCLALGRVLVDPGPRGRGVRPGACSGDAWAGPARRGGGGGAARATRRRRPVVDLVANPLDAAYITPKLAWLRATSPAVFDATRWFSRRPGSSSPG